MHRGSLRRVATARLGFFSVMAVVALFALAPRGIGAQPIVGTEPGIVAVGYGSASGSAAAVHLQFLIGPDQFAMMGGPPTSVTPDQLDPIVQALVAAGVPEAATEVTVPSTVTGMYGPGGPEIGEIRATVDQPEQGQIADFVQAVREATRDAGLAVYHVGARFEATDCEALLQEAREAAVADAQTRAEGLAEAVGVTLGDLIQVAESPYFGPTGAGSCGGDLPPEVGGFGPFGPGTDPAFDPSVETEAVAYAQVSLTFAIGQAGESTPSA